MMNSFKKFFIVPIIAVMLITFAFATNAVEYQEGDYTYILENGEATIVNASETLSGDVVIPSSLGGYPVTSIGDSAFYYCYDIRNIIIPEGVVSVGDYAFYSCGLCLESISIPTTLKSMGCTVFNEMKTELTKVYITSLEAWCNIDFSNNYSVPLNHSCNLEYDSECSSNVPNLYLNGEPVTELVISESITDIKDFAFYSCHITSVKIPGTVSSVGDYSFSNCNHLKKIEISDGVKVIGAGAFGQSASFSDIYIPASVTDIGADAFAWCSNLNSINVDRNNRFYSSENGVLFDKEKTTLIRYPGGKTGGYIVSNGVLKIAENAFRSCDKLTDIVVSDGVTYIGECAFEYCRNLKSVNLPGSIVDIGNYAFQSCVNLSSVLMPYGIKTIGNYAFEGCWKLESLEIPDSVTYIGSSAFSGCYNLRNITISNSVTKLSNNVFRGSGIRSIIIPNSVTSIDAEAFESCSLVSVKIPESVTSIGDGAFEDCNNLRSVEILGAVTSMGEHAFTSCNNLTHVIFSENVRDIGNYAFSSCDSLKFIEIPKNVTRIGNFAFVGCSNLERAIISTEIDAIYFKLFYNCSNLKSIEIPKSITSVGLYAFDNCHNLTDVYYGGSVQDRNNINISNYNEELIYATWHYNSKMCRHTNAKVTNVVPATCVSEGYTTYSCQCGYSYDANYVAIIPHADFDSDYRCDYGCGYEFEKPSDPEPDVPTPEDPEDSDVPNNPEAPEDSDVPNNPEVPEEKQNFIEKIIEWFKNIFDKLFGWIKF